MMMSASSIVCSHSGSELRSRLWSVMRVSMLSKLRELNRVAIGDAKCLKALPRKLRQRGLHWGREDFGELFLPTTLHRRRDKLAQLNRILHRGGSHLLTSPRSTISALTRHI